MLLQVAHQHLENNTLQHDQHNSNNIAVNVTSRVSQTVFFLSISPAKYVATSIGCMYKECSKMNRKSAQNRPAYFIRKRNYLLGTITKLLS